MTFGLDNQTFIVTGASSGLGRAVALQLASQGARILAVARRKDLLEELHLEYPDNVEILPGDVLDDRLLDEIIRYAESQAVHGVFVNAGGPPAKSIEETAILDWDQAYRLIIRWKIYLVKGLLPHFARRHYGRILFSESSSVRQPVENLVLSNSLRMAIAGFSKTIVQEYSGNGLTSNLIAPGHHDTDAVKRLFQKKSQQTGTSFEQARQESIGKIPVGRMGTAIDFASLAAWLLSPASGFVTGQVFTLDGGVVKASI